MVSSVPPTEEASSAQSGGPFPSVTAHPPAPDNAEAKSISTASVRGAITPKPLNSPHAQLAVEEESVTVQTPEQATRPRQDAATTDGTAHPTSPAVTPSVASSALSSRWEEGSSSGSTSS